MAFNINVCQPFLQFIAKEVKKKKQQNTFYYEYSTKAEQSAESKYIQHNHTLLYLVNVCFSFYSSFNPLSFDSNFEEKVQNKHTKKI